MMKRLLVLCVAAGLGCAVPRGRDPVIFREGQAEAWLSLEDEIRLGRRCLDRLGAHSADDRLQEVVAALARTSHRPDLPWTVVLTDAPAVNAIGLPGGLIVVSREWRAIVGADAAAALAHEVAHICLRHATVNQFDERLRDASRARAHTPGQEAEADRFAALYMALAGWDPIDPSRAWVRLRMAGSNGYARDHGLESWALLRENQRDEILAMRRHYRGPGRVNDRYREILAEHPLVRSARREAPAAAAPPRPAVELRGAHHATNARGQPILSCDVENPSARRICDVRVQLLYLDRQDRVIYRDDATIGGLGPRERRSTDFVIKAVPYVNLKVVVSEVN